MGVKHITSPGSLDAVVIGYHYCPNGDINLSWQSNHVCSANVCDAESNACPSKVYINVTIARMPYPICTRLHTDPLVAAQSCKTIRVRRIMSPSKVYMLLTTAQMLHHVCTRLHTDPLPADQLFRMIQGFGGS